MESENLEKHLALLFLKCQYVPKSPLWKYYRWKFLQWLFMSASMPRIYKLSFMWTTSLEEKETNFEWFSNHLKNTSVKVNQAEGLEKYLLLLLLCSTEQNPFPPEIWKAGSLTSFKPLLKVTFPMTPYPTTLFKAVTLPQPPSTFFPCLLLSKTLITSWQTTYFTILQHLWFPQPKCKLHEGRIFFFLLYPPCLEYSCFGRYRHSVSIWVNVLVNK